MKKSNKVYVLDVGELYRTKQYINYIKPETSSLLVKEPEKQKPLLYLYSIKILEDYRLPILINYFIYGKDKVFIITNISNLNEMIYRL